MVQEERERVPIQEALRPSNKWQWPDQTVLALDWCEPQDTQIRWRWTKGSDRIPIPEDNYLWVNTIELILYTLTGYLTRGPDWCAYQGKLTRFLYPQHTLASRLMDARESGLGQPLPDGLEVIGLEDIPFWCLIDAALKAIAEGQERYEQLRSKIRELAQV